MGSSDAYPPSLLTTTAFTKFATVRLRQRVTKAVGSRQKGLLIAFELLEMAQKRWRRINGTHAIPLVRARVRFTDGVEVERRTDRERPRA